MRFTIKHQSRLDVIYTHFHITSVEQLSLFSNLVSSFHLVTDQASVQVQSSRNTNINIMPLLFICQAFCVYTCMIRFLVSNVLLLDIEQKCNSSPDSFDHLTLQMQGQRNFKFWLVSGTRYTCTCMVTLTRVFWNPPPFPTLIVIYFFLLDTWIHLALHLCQLRLIPNSYQTHHQHFAVIRLFFFSKINACTHRRINRFFIIWTVAVKNWSNSIARLTNL